MVLGDDSESVEEFDLLTNEIRIIIDIMKVVPEDEQHSLLDSMIFKAREMGNLEYSFSELFNNMTTDERKYYFTLLSEKFDFEEKSVY